jgi:hypothetical protein
MDRLTSISGRWMRAQEWMPPPHSWPVGLMQVDTGTEVGEFFVWAHEDIRWLILRNTALESTITQLRQLVRDLADCNLPATCTCGDLADGQPHDVDCLEGRIESATKELPS